MSLTIGNGPFGSKPAGTFNFERLGPAHVLYTEDSPKRVRATFAGRTVADSRRAKMLHETGLHGVYYFPRDDVSQDLLRPSDTSTHCPFKGDASYWSIQVDDQRANDAVWEYTSPLEGAKEIAGHVAFFWDRVEAWFEEDEQIHVHPRSPFTRVDVRASSRRVTVRHGDTVLAESYRPKMLFETGLPARYYLPRDDVRSELLNASATITRCPYKGAAAHWSLADGGADDVAWSYADPLLEAVPVTGYVSFYPDRVTVEVDGETLS